MSRRRRRSSIKGAEERASDQSRFGHRPGNTRWPHFKSSKVLWEASSQILTAKHQEISFIDHYQQTKKGNKRYLNRSRRKGHLKHQNAFRKCSQEEPWSLLWAVCEGTNLQISIKDLPKPVTNCFVAESLLFRFLSQSRVQAATTAAVVAPALGLLPLATATHRGRSDAMLGKCYCNSQGAMGRNG